MNYRLFRAINNLSGNHAVDAVMRVAAQDLIFVVFAALGVICLLRLRHRQFRPVVMTGTALALTFLIGLLGAAVYAEKRPFQTHRVHQLMSHAAGQSFPSDHATAAFGVALAVGVFLSRPAGLLLVTAALLIGFARIYEGIHYPSDIAGGLAAAVIGTAAVAVVDNCLRRVRTGHPRQRVDVHAMTRPPRQP